MVVSVKSISPYSRQSGSAENNDHKDEQFFVVEFEGEDPTDFVRTKDVTPDEVAEYTVGAKFNIFIEKVE
jgi:hypothetical protein